jgi:hypothetical protein
MNKITTIVDSTEDRDHTEDRCWAQRGYNKHKGIGSPIRRRDWKLWDKKWRKWSNPLSIVPTCHLHSRELLLSLDTPAVFNPISYCCLWIKYHSPIGRPVNLDGLISHWNSMHIPTDRETIYFDINPTNLTKKLKTAATPYGIDTGSCARVWVHPFLNFESHNFSLWKIVGEPLPFFVGVCYDNGDGRAAVSKIVCLVVCFEPLKRNNDNDKDNSWRSLHWRWLKASLTWRQPYFRAAQIIWYNPPDAYKYFPWAGYDPPCLLQ